MKLSEFNDTEAGWIVDDSTIFEIEIIQSNVIRQLFKK